MGFSQIKVELQDVMGSDRSIADSAWTSSYSHDRREQKVRTEEDVAKIIKILADSGHGVPFESVIFRFWIYLPTFSDRQHMTHRICSNSGLSGRWRTLPKEYYEIPDNVMDILYKASTGGPDLVELYYASTEAAVTHYSLSIETLKKAEKAGTITNAEFRRAREILRGQMPQALMTERVTIMNLRSFANYYRLRSDSHAQPEMQEIARLMLQAIESKGNIPLAIQALKDVQWKI